MSNEKKSIYEKCCEIGEQISAKYHLYHTGWSKQWVIKDRITEAYSIASESSNAWKSFGEIDPVSVFGFFQKRGNFEFHKEAVLMYVAMVCPVQGNYFQVKKKIAIEKVTNNSFSIIRNGKEIGLIHVGAKINWFATYMLLGLKDHESESFKPFKEATQ